MQILCLSTGCTSLQSYQFTRVLYHFFNFYVNEKYIIVKSKELCLQLEIFRQDQRRRRRVNFNSGHRKDSCCFALGAPSLLSYLPPKRFMIIKFRTSTTFLSSLSFLLLPISWENWSQWRELTQHTTPPVSYHICVGRWVAGSPSRWPHLVSESLHLVYSSTLPTILTSLLQLPFLPFSWEVIISTGACLYFSYLKKKTLSSSYFSSSY